MKTRRPGLTLIEVLVAIFVMGIGMLALLTLFPLGAMRMDQAIKEERASQAARNVLALSNIYNVRMDSDILASFSQPSAVAAAAPLAGEPSYAVYLDGFGYHNGVAGVPGKDSVSTYVTRRPGSFASTNTPSLYVPFYALLDDFKYESTLGTPKKFGATLARENHYSWGAMIRRPNNDVESVATCFACVYHRRRAAGPFEDNYAGSIDMNANRISLVHAADTPPNVKAGGWILDATHQFQDNSTPTRTINCRHANFYRVTRTTTTTTGTDLDLHTPLLGYDNAKKDAVTGLYLPIPASVVVMHELFEVFNLGTGK